MNHVVRTPRRPWAVAIVLVIAWSALVVGAAEARTNTRDKPVIFVHGYNGTNCTRDWRDLMLDMRAAGFTGNFYLLRYLSSDSNCDVSGISNAFNASLFGSGSHDAVYGHAGTAHDNDTDIRHLAWHLSKWISGHIGADAPADVVAHSMGGLMIRFAIAKQGIGDWPALNVEDVVTLGTPHNGVRFSGWIGTVQGDQMEPDSFFIEWLRDRAANPQGIDGTEWSALGSDGDVIVGPNTATRMNAENRVRFGLLPSPILHAEYMHVGGRRDSAVWNGSSYVTTYTYGPMPMIRAALQYGGW